MNNLEIRSIHSADIDEIWSWQPARPEEVFFVLHLDIGEVGDERSDSFQVVIATPEGIQAKILQVGGIIDRNLIVLKEYSWDMLIQHLDLILAHCKADSWTDTVIKLQKYLRWEYEDYITPD
jgi:hypothetical protein